MRLFLGIALPKDIRDACAALARAASRAIPGRYAPAENYHITLAFLGDVGEERVGDAAGALAACVATFPAPRVALGELSYFKRPENAILELRAHAAPGLEPLHGALVAALRARGLPADDGPFAPHITLARHARIAPGALDAVAGARGAFVCREAHVFLSARGADGVVRYTPLRSAPFAPAQGGDGGKNKESLPFLA